MPVSPDVAFRFEIVNVSVVLPFNGTLAAPKALLMVGGPITVIVAVLLVAPVPPSVELMAPVVLLFAPALTLVTFTTRLQDAPGASDAPDKLIAPLPLAAERFPPQVLLTPLGLATDIPAGNWSKKLMPCSVTTELGLLMMKVRVVAAFAEITDAPNALLMVGGKATLTLAEAVFPVPPLVELTLLVVLFFRPSAAPVTFTVTVQEVLTANVAPVMEMELLPPVAVTVPLQV